MTLFIQKIGIDWQRISRGSYLREIPALQGVDELALTAPVTFFVGENGTGKSTLLEAIAVAYGFNPEGGTRNYSFSTHDSHSELCGALRIGKGYRKVRWGYFLRAESFYNVATKEEEYAKDPSCSTASEELHRKSHGESFLAIAQKHFSPDGVYILDEPEAALSPQRQLTLLMEIHRFACQGAQFIIASHSPILLGIPNGEILSFDEGRIHPVLYEETDSYQVTELFINNREYLLERLLENI
ncbi:MAG: AAA family ATPase [Lachnospiraceae bacterium]|nr:AAA family ATPase [Lachnospiraceae bacterium]